MGWFGAVVAYLAVALAVLSGPDVASLQVGLPLMRQLVWWVILPFNLLSMATGVASSLASPWGLLRHYWVATKFIINSVTTVFLLGYTQEINQAAAIASRPALAASDLAALRCASRRASFMRRPLWCCYCWRPSLRSTSPRA